MRMGHDGGFHLTQEKGDHRLLQREVVEQKANIYSTQGGSRKTVIFVGERLFETSRKRPTACNRWSFWLSFAWRGISTCKNQVPDLTPQEWRPSVWLSGHWFLAHQDPQGTVTRVAHNCCQSFVVMIEGCMHVWCWCGVWLLTRWPFSEKIICLGEFKVFYLFSAVLHSHLNSFTFPENPFLQQRLYDWWWSSYSNPLTKHFSQCSSYQRQPEATCRLLEPSLRWASLWASPDNCDHCHHYTYYLSPTVVHLILQ